MDEGVANNFNFSMNKKLFYVIIIALVVIALILLGSFFARTIKDNIHNEIPICGDGSFPGTCSLTKPYYCSEEGVLIYDSELCGCPDKGEFVKNNKHCASVYQTNPHGWTLYYDADNENDSILFEVYGGVNDYLSFLRQSMIYSDGEVFSRADFKLNKMDDDVQKTFLMPLVLQIQNIAPHDRDKQARIAVSIVQNISFGESNKTYSFGGTKLNYSRYPYQVLYDYEGVCGEKTELLAFLLRELGFGVSFFYYPEENHEALGIKCPVEKSFSSTGYCFVETTGASIISDNEINYADIGKLYSIPELYFISEGLTFGEENFYEYRDAKKLQRIRNSVEKRGWLGFFKKRSYEKLREKYGLVDEYYGG